VRAGCRFAGYGELWSIPLSEFNCALLISISEKILKAGRMFLSFCPSRAMSYRKSTEGSSRRKRWYKAFCSMGGLDDASDIVQLLEIIEGPKELKISVDHASPTHHLQVRLRLLPCGLA